MKSFTLSKDTAGLLIIDVQERLVDTVERSCEILQTMLKLIQGMQILNVPVFVTEQYPEGLGPTITPIKNILGPQQTYLAKTCFSGLREEEVKNALAKSPITQWILVGIEAHVCVLQTAKDLLAQEAQVTVLNDAISSRSIYDFSTAIAEMRDIGVRVSSAETVLFELVGDSKSMHFKSISQLIKSCR